MDSEIQFLLNLVLNFKVPSELKKICLERIGLIEQNLRQPQRAAQPMLQAPSMQKIMEQMPHPSPVPIPTGARDKETGLVNVTTSVTSGGMTKGPSKVFR